MRDLIDRQAAIDALKKQREELLKGLDKNSNVYGIISASTGIMICTVGRLPSAEEEAFEWCDTCKEYDQEKHCCHRWTKVIRNTVEELRVVRCRDCKYAEYMDDVQSLWCTECGNGRTVAPYDFCSYGERRADE